MSKHDLNTCACITCEHDREIMVTLMNLGREPGEAPLTMEEAYQDVAEFLDAPIVRREPEQSDDDG